ncbi:MAG: MoaD/ThiS family protein [SAR324 cluster bacterium]|nr:MoaD/ThiS family protein [SAR324 cluster bacterium]
MATVYIPALMQELTGGADHVEVAVPAGERITVRQLLEAAGRQHAGLLEALLYEGDLAPHLAVFIDNDHALMGLRAKLNHDSEVRLLPPIVGGSGG